MAGSDDGSLVEKWWTVNGLSSAEMSRWAVMWALAFAIYTGLKALSWLGRARGEAPMWKHVAYLLGWPGMDVNAFLFSPASEVVRPTEWIAAWVKFSAGVLIVVLAVRSVTSVDRFLVGWSGMIGIVLTLHFGLFHLLSCFWRRLGVQAVWHAASRCAAWVATDPNLAC